MAIERFADAYTPACDMCGAVIPEGRQVCSDCEAGRWSMKAT